MRMKKMKKISAVYKIVNTVTGDFYVGSSKDAMNRWASHKWSSSWKRYPNNKMYQDMQKYGVDKFRFQILAPIIPEYLKQVEQRFIEMLKPTYNSNRAYGPDVEKRKASNNRYNQSEKCKEHQKSLHQSEKYKEHQKLYRNQICYYNGETLTLDNLRTRFRRDGIPQPTVEAKKYILEEE